MWKLFILTFLCLILTTSCDDDKSNTTQIVAAAAGAGSSSDGNTGSSSSTAAAAQVTSVKTEESSDPSSGSDDKSGDVKTTKIVTAAAAAGSSSDGNSGSSSSAAAAVQVTSVKTNESSDSSSGSGNKSNSGDGFYYNCYNSEEDDDDKDCIEEERDDDYDCSSAMHRVQLSIIEISFIRKYYFVDNNKLNYNNYCDLSRTQGQEGHIGSPIATWYVLALTYLYTKNETQKELSDFLRIYNKDECRCVMKKMRRLIKPSIKDLYSYSLLVMADYKYGFTDLFKSDTKEYADSKAVNSNFTRPQMSARKANKYTAAKTRNVIQDVVSKQEASTVFNLNQIIINVIGTLLKPVLKISLNTAKKFKGIYYGLNEPMLTEFIYQEVIYNSTKSRELDAWVMEIPLNNTYTKCFAIFPNTRCGLKPMLAKLASEPQILLDVIERLTRRIIKLTLPLYTNSETVENVVPALQSTCKIDRVFDIKKSQIIDSCGRSLNRSITYIHEKSTAKFFLLKGAEPYKKASAKDCPECGKPVDICINYPALFLYMGNGIILQSIIGQVERVESCTNE